MLKFFSKKPETILGVDIGTVSIKVAEVRGGKKPALLNYGMLESKSALVRGSSAFEPSSFKVFDEEIVELLKLLLGKMKAQTKYVSASIPAHSAFTTVLTLPQMSPADLQKTIAFQARQYIPIPVSEAALDWAQVGEFTNDKGFKNLQIMLISVPQEIIKHYQSIFSSAGLTLRALEVESISLVRALTAGDPTPTFIVDIGSRATSILVAEKGQLKFAGRSDFAGSSLTQSLVNGLNISSERAEELKRERGIVNTETNQELSTIMVPFIDAIINEVRQVEFGYRNQFPNATKIERLILTGGGSNLLGLQKYFGDRMGIPVVKASPLVKFDYPSDLAPLVPELNTKLNIALGLPLREFGS